MLAVVYIGIFPSGAAFLSWNEGVRLVGPNHYAVAIGYDEKHIYFMDPSTLGHYTFIPIAEFLDRWHDMDGQVKLISH